MNTLRLAFRGLARNRRRSLMTLAAIALGFSAIALFAGYTHNIYDGLSRQSIHGEMLGHLTLSKPGMDKEGKLYPERYLLSSAEVAKISELLRSEPHVRLVAPRLALSGIISNGRASTIFIAEGIEPQAMDKLQENLLTAGQRANKIFNGVMKHLDPAHTEVVELSAGLAELLHLKLHDQAAMLVNTISGQANALDVTVGGTFNTGNAGSNDKFAFIPLALAQSLYDVEGRADRLTVLLDDVAQTEPMRARLQEKLRAAGFDLQIKTWEDLSSFYTQVHGMFDMIFGFIFSIVLTVVIMSVANSMSMTVVERTREIGTLRAIGLRRAGVKRLFATESLLLSLFGCLVGVVITLVVRYSVNNAGISYVPPNSAAPTLLLVDLDVIRMLFTLVLMVAVGTLAAWLPARRAAKQQIIESLGHV
ncbi:MAG TPA: FtsX-like permease family protein [Gallionella sp.]|nr:FtsX-like permease family protein [Gallionella sp.]